MSDFVEDHLKEIGFFRPEDSEVAAAAAILESVQDVLLRQPGARAVDVGFRILQGKNRFTQRVAIRVHVENKLTEQQIREGSRPIWELDFKTLTGVASQKVTDDGKPAVLLFHPNDTEQEAGFYLDVVEARYLPSSGATHVSQAKLNQDLELRELEQLVRGPVHPLVGGISVGSSRGVAGTLGAVVWDRTDGSPCLLSNWHVLAGRLDAAAGSPCFQPALLDGGRPTEDLVGRLKRSLFDRHGDAALAEIVCSRPYSGGEILGLWVPVAGIVKPRLGMPVRKWGRTTGFTHGFIDGLHFTGNLEYDRVGVQRFENQIHVAARYKGRELSAEGDSGTVFVTKYEPRDPHLDAEDPASRARIHDLKERSLRVAAEARETPREEPKRDKTTKEISREDKHGGEAYRQRSEESAEPSLVDSRVYFAVALNFAGDAPGAHSGEFALASPIHDLAERLDFSFRPVFFPRSSYVIQSTPTPPREAPPRPDGGSDDGVVRPGGGQGDPAGGPGTEVRPIRP